MNFPMNKSKKSSIIIGISENKIGHLIGINFGGSGKIVRTETKRNPKWTRDEIIVTLDFYFSHYPRIPGKESQEILDLSRVLRGLTSRLGKQFSETYRNPNGVYMKLMNFQHFNRSHDGEGLKGGSQLDEEVFREFENDLEKLKNLSNTIKSWVSEDYPDDVVDLDDDLDFEVEEGRLLTKIHRYKERDRSIIKKKKDYVYKTSGSLSCECCGFDFQSKFGELGDGFIECHHNQPVSELKPGQKTSLLDLSLVCSNCHRMIHRRKPWLTVNELKKLIEHTED